MKMYLLLFFIFSHFFQTKVYAQVHVQGYYRKNGTYVQPHYRSNPDGNPYNNWSYPGNTNPYTGKVATGNSDTYLNKYRQNDSNHSNQSNNNYLYQNEISTGTNEAVDNSYNPLAMPPKESYRINYVPETLTSEPYVQKLFVESEQLNLRTGPSTKERILLKLRKGQVMKVLYSHQMLDWVKVEVKYVNYATMNVETIQGYVHWSYVGFVN